MFFQPSCAPEYVTVVVKTVDVWVPAQIVEGRPTAPIQALEPCSSATLLSWCILSPIIPVKRISVNEEMSGHTL